MSHERAGEDGGRDSGGAPGEAIGLAHDVLFLSPVARADQSHGRDDLIELTDDLLEGEDDGLLDESGSDERGGEAGRTRSVSPLDAKFPAGNVVVEHPGYGAMVPHVEEVLAGQEAWTG